MRLNELQGNIVYPWKLYASGTTSTYTSYEFVTDNDIKYRVLFSRLTGYEFSMTEVYFAQTRYGDMLTKITGTGDALAVFSTVIDICADYLKNHQNPDVLVFKGIDDLAAGVTSRTRLYASAAPKMGKLLNREVRTHRDFHSITVYLIKKDPRLIRQVEQQFDLGT